MTVGPDTRRALQRAERQVRKAIERRDTAIREAVEAGGSLREVAELVGVSHMTVDKIVKRQAS